MEDRRWGTEPTGQSIVDWRESRRGLGLSAILYFPCSHSLPLRVPSRPSRKTSSLDVDPGDLHRRVVLAVADLLVVAFAALVLDGGDLGPLHRAEHVGGHGGPGDERGADLGLAFAA